MEKSPLTCKVVIVGNQGVGKTCIAKRYVEGVFPEQAKATVAAAFMKKRLQLPSCKLHMELWDTAGAERFRSMSPIYFRNASGAVIVLDVLSPASLQAVREWARELKEQCNSDVVLALALNKTDLPPGKRIVTRDQALEAARAIGCSLYETSAVSNEGIDQMFYAIATAMAEAAEARAAAGTALQGAAAGQRLAVEEDRQAGAGDAAACSC